MQKYLSTTWRLWKLLKPFHKDFYVQVVFIFFAQGLGIITVLLSAKLIDGIVSKNFQFAFIIAITFFVIKLLDVIINYFVDMHSFRKLEIRVQQFLQEYSLNKIFKLNASQYLEDHSAIKFQVISRGESATEEVVNKILLEVLPTITQILFSLIAIGFYSISISLIVLVTVLIAIIWSYTFTNYHRVFIKKNMDNWDKQNKIRSEAFQHLYLIKILSQSKFFIKKYLAARGSVLEYHDFTWSKNFKHTFKRKTFFTVSRNISTLVLIYIAFLGQITVGGIYAVWSWINNIYEQIFVIIRALRQIPLRFVEIEKYLDIIDKKPDFVEESANKFTDGDIIFENLSFKYPKADSNVLEKVNINIPQGSKVAFVGHSGSGKTTITRLLLRSYDYNNNLENNINKNENKLETENIEKNIKNKELFGSIKINGVELKDIDASDLRKHIGYVEQHVDLFDDTIKNNILFGVDEKVLHLWEKGNSEKSHINSKGVDAKYENKLEEKLEEVAKLARIDEFYHRLGEGKFETQIGERGIKLSGGERQRIGIARAIIKNPSILIFDEATSALDTVNEKYIKEAIDNVSKGRTTIIIAHRLSTVVDSDTIFVMDKGQVVASGNHTQLIESSTHYQELIQHQELK